MSEISDQEAGSTRVSLVRKLQASSAGPAWKEFFDRYWLMLYRTARRAGLKAADAEDVVQNALVNVSERIQRLNYEPGKGSFRGWLLRITHRRIADHWRAGALERRHRAPGADPAEPRAPDAFETIWNEEWMIAVQRLATEHTKTRVSARQYQIFDLYVLQRRSVGDVCAALGVNPAQVYLARCRVGRVFAREVARLRDRL